MNPLHMKHAEISESFVIFFRCQVFLYKRNNVFYTSLFVSFLVFFIWRPQGIRQNVCSLSGLKISSTTELKILLLVFMLPFMIIICSHQFLFLGWKVSPVGLDIFWRIRDFFYQRMAPSYCLACLLPSYSNRRWGHVSSHVKVFSQKSIGIQ